MSNQETNKETINKAEQEYNALIQFAKLHDYPHGKVTNILDLFQKLKFLIEKLSEWNELKISDNEFATLFYKKFEGDLDAYNEEKMRILDPIMQGKKKRVRWSKVP